MTFEEFLHVRVQFHLEEVGFALLRCLKNFSRSGPVLL